MHTTTKFLTALLLGAALSTPVLAEPPQGKGKAEKHDKQGKQGGKQSHEQGGSALVISISASEARRIALAQRTVGYAALPPGIRKNLARGKPLPPGIAKRGVPGPVLAQLPQYPGYEWQVAGSDLVLIAIATAVVTEILSGVFD